MILDRVTGAMNKWIYQTELLPRPDYRLMPDKPSPEQGKEAIEGINQAAFVSNTPPKDVGYDRSGKVVKTRPPHGTRMDTLV